MCDFVYGNLYGGELVVDLLVCMMIWVEVISVMFVVCVWVVMYVGCMCVLVLYWL